MKNINYKLIFKIICSFGLLLFLFFNIELDSLSQLKWDVLFPFFIAILITLCALFIMAYRWKILVKEYLSVNPPTKVLYKYYLVGMFFNIFLPGAIGGDVMRTKKLISRYEISIKKASVITVVERVAGIYGLCLLLSLSFAVLNFPPTFLITKYIPTWVLRILPLIVLLFIPFIKVLLDKYNLSTSYSFIIKTVAVLLLSQMGDILIAYVFSIYFGLNLSLSAFIFIMPIVYIATVLPISLGGLGVREGSFSMFMVLYGVDSSIAIIISLLMYLVKVSVGVIGYFVYMKDKE